MRLVFIIHVSEVFRRTTTKHVSGVGKDAVFDTGHAGWYIRLGEGANAIALHVGEEEPKVEKGQKVKLILEIG